MRVLFFLLLIFLLLATFVLADVVTLTSTATTVWWSEIVTISGNANYSNGTGIANADVNITVGTVKCNNQTDANGAYSCTFLSPEELGTYDVLVNITNSSGSSVTNTTTLTVKPKYGATPTGTVNRVVYEAPMLLQEPSGKIRVAIVRVMVWRA